MIAPVVAPSPIQNSRKAEPIVPPTKVSPINLEAPDANPTDLPGINSSDIPPPSIKGDANTTPIIRQGTLEPDQLIKPKK